MYDFPPPPSVGHVNVSVSIPAWGHAADPPRRRERDILYEPPPSWQTIEPGTLIVRFTHAVYREVMKTLGEVVPEAGGIILGPAGSDIVTTFHRDENGSGSPTTFTLDAKGLTAKLRTYREAGLEMMGVVHSHPAGVKAPSSFDLEYAAKLLANPRNEGTDELLMPIYCEGILYPYIFRRDSPKSSLLAQLVLV